jgi:hypothetical protein
MINSKYLGVDIGGTKVHVGVVQAGVLVQEARFETSATASKEQILAELVQNLAPLVDAEVMGIGIGVPGLVDEENGIVHNVQNIPSWREVHLKQHLANHFDKPVYLTNDANAFAVGEKMYGKGQPYANQVGIALGSCIRGRFRVPANLGACLTSIKPLKTIAAASSSCSALAGRGASGTLAPSKATQWPERTLRSLGGTWAVPFRLSCTASRQKPFFWVAR